MASWQYVPFTIAGVVAVAAMLEAWRKLDAITAVLFGRPRSLSRWERVHVEADRREPLDGARSNG